MYVVGSEGGLGGVGLSRMLDDPFQCEICEVCRLKLLSGYG